MSQWNGYQNEQTPLAFQRFIGDDFASFHSVTF
jgi:hypothetical protein